MLNLQLREPSAGEVASTQSIVRPEPVTYAEPFALAETAASADIRETLAAGEEGEFEIVLGKRQLAGVLFVAIVILVVFSALSYLAGKAASPKKATFLPPPTPVLQSTVTIPQATIVKAEDLPPAVATQNRDAAPALSPAPISPGAPASTPAPPLFANPATGAVYLQMGAVEKGIAVIFVEGLRRRGFEAFAAPGPNEKIFRVLIGPLDHESYAHAKDILDSIGLSTFARRYQQETVQSSRSGNPRSSGTNTPSLAGPAETAAPTPSAPGSGAIPVGNDLGTLVDGAGLPVHVVH